MLINVNESRREIYKHSLLVTGKINLYEIQLNCSLKIQ